jgi:hypothetical protein
MAAKSRAKALAKDSTNYVFQDFLEHCEAVGDKEENICYTDALAEVCMSLVL